MKLKIFLRAAVLSMCAAQTGFPQTTAAEFKVEIEALQKKLQEDDAIFSKFLESHESITRAKKSERALLLENTRQIELENTGLKRRADEINLVLRRIESSTAARLEVMKNEIVLEMQRIDQGIPFDTDRRRAVLASLIYDIESQKANPLEVLNRVNQYFDQEELLAYDSQVIEEITVIDGKQENASVLRIGRVFFAVKTAKDVFLFEKTDQGYNINTGVDLGIAEKRTIQHAMETVQGKKAPDLLALPFFSTAITVNRSRK